METLSSNIPQSSVVLNSSLHPVEALDVRAPLSIWVDRRTKQRLVSYRNHPLDESLYECVAQIPPLFPEHLGGSSFTQSHGVRFPYIAGAMANGIAGIKFVHALSHANILAFFGAAGLSLEKIEDAVEKLAGTHSDKTYSCLHQPWGANLIHTPNEPELEWSTASCYVKHKVRFVSASAYLNLTLPLVYYSTAGLGISSKGVIERRTNLFAKVSRPEVARLFMSPAPEAMLQKLVERGLITSRQAQLAKLVPIAEDITVEADSGGHTDNQSLLALFPVIDQLRHSLQNHFAYSRPIRMGAAGGIGTPLAAASAFSLGADYILTGSINQATVEAQLSNDAKQLLCHATFGDVMMAPAADMFELNVDLQVLKKGTMFGVRAQKLRRIYQSVASLDELSTAQINELETKILGDTLDNIWNQCVQFWTSRDEKQIENALENPKHKMALVFRWYLGMSSRWAIMGQNDRKLDYQIWCGPAMASFNDWVRGSFLEPLENRDVLTIALNILEGAAYCTRLTQLKQFGIQVDSGHAKYKPMRLTL